MSSRASRDAIFVASPDLDEAIEIWLADPESARGQRASARSSKYFSRAAGRATPFGLFAGTSVGRLGEATDLILDARERCLRHSRLDMDYLFALADALAKDPVRRAGFTLKPNSSLYRGCRAHALHGARLAGEERTYHLVAAESSDALTATLARAATGSRGRGFGAVLSSTPDFARGCPGLFAEPVDSQILVPRVRSRGHRRRADARVCSRLAACEATRALRPR